MKRRDLEKELTICGWKLIRNGGNHDVWGNGKGEQEPVPRHREVSELLAKKIIRTAKAHPGEK